jgi:hypothetical protein
MNRESENNVGNRSSGADRDVENEGGKAVREEAGDVGETGE